MVDGPGQLDGRTLVTTGRSRADSSCWTGGFNQGKVLVSVVNIVIYTLSLTPASPGDQSSLRGGIFNSNYLFYVPPGRIRDDIAAAEFLYVV